MINKSIVKIHPRLAVVMHDLLMVWFAWTTITSIRWSFEVARPQLGLFGPEVGLVLLAQGVIFWSTGLYKGLWRFASLPDLWNIGRAAILGAQQGKVMYPEFKQLSQQAGCIGYTVWITGRHVTYYGRKGETHVERFPS